MGHLDSQTYPLHTYPNSLQFQEGSPDFQELLLDLQGQNKFDIRKKEKLDSSFHYYFRQIPCFPVERHSRLYKANQEFLSVVLNWGRTEETHRGSLHESKTQVIVKTGACGRNRSVWL